MSASRCFFPPPPRAQWPPLLRGGNEATSAVALAHLYATRTHTRTLSSLLVLCYWFLKRPAGPSAGILGIDLGAHELIGCYIKAPNGSACARTHRGLGIRRRALLTHTHTPRTGEARAAHTYTGLGIRRRALHTQREDGGGARCSHTHTQRTRRRALLLLLGGSFKHGWGKGGGASMCDMAAAGGAGLRIYIPNGVYLFDNEHMATQRAARGTLARPTLPQLDSQLERRRVEFDSLN